MDHQSKQPEGENAALLGEWEEGAPIWPKGILSGFDQFQPWDNSRADNADYPWEVHLQKKGL